jgi:tRNA pseudouridine38-40 synthase
VDTGTSLRLRLSVQYDGSEYHGWQLQPDRRTVQGELESALSRLADSPRSILASGRTDAGVHALGQIVAVDMPRGWDAPELQRALNAVLPPDIRVEDVRPVRGDFHPRYDARARTYEYRVGTDPKSRSPFRHRWCWPLCQDLDRGHLHRAATLLEGEHSFLAFAKSGQPERGDRCRVTRAAWDDWELGPRFTITADRFLHHMVRYLVGTMVDMARGRRPLDDLPALLRSEPGLETSPPAPPTGLFLTSVEYPDDIDGVDPTTPSSARSAAPA